MAGTTLSRRRKVTFLAAVFPLSLVACEVLLQILSWLSTPVHNVLGGAEPAIQDRQLGHRPNPDFPGHDARGFRNVAALSSADMVLLGDSQTYGTGVSRDEAWPNQLHQLTGLTTYGMAYGGYGPAHSLVLLPEALNLSPKIVIEAMYAGNDFFDCYNLVYNNSSLPTLKTTDAAVLQAMAEADRRKPLIDAVQEAFTMGSPNSRARTFLSRRSKLYGLLRAAKRVLAAPADWASWRAFALARPDFCQILDCDKARTILTPQYRFLVLDETDPRIREGKRIALESLQRMREGTEQTGSRFLVVLIPTKDLVFSGLLDNCATEEVKASLQSLIHAETQMWKSVKDWLRTHDIAFVDVLDALQQGAQSGEQPYPMSWDGHPNAVGHQIIAATVRSKLVELEWDVAEGIQQAAGND